jgi:ATP-binding cassette subfamily B (MDR/TAP) protein 1
MAEENISHRDVTTEQAATLTNHAVVDSGKDSENTDKRKDSNRTKGKEETTNTVPYYKLFSFADSLDFLLMFVGTVAAIGSGISMPFMTIIFGALVDSFGRTTNTKDVIHEVSEVFYNKNLDHIYIYIYAT